VIIVLGAAVLATLVEAFVPQRARRGVQIFVSLVSVAGAGVWALKLALDAGGDTAVVAASGTIAVDPTALYLQMVLAVCGLLGLLVIADRTSQGEDAFAPQASAVPGSEYELKARKAGIVQTDVYPLVLFALGGMMLFPAANDLLTMFVALEVLSLPLYLLSGTARRRRLLSQEASLKYFLLGALASAFFLFGVAWVYGATGHLKLTSIAVAISTGALGMDPMLITGVVLIGVGLLFKVGAVPFHSWTPDVYQGAPTPITGFMAACTKIAAFGALLRVLYSMAPGLDWDLRPVLWTVAIATMVVGTVIGTTQKDVKRLLAYSAIAHAGFILVAVITFSSAGLSAALFYLATYGVATVGAFGVVSLVREVDHEGHIQAEATRIDQWRGLGKRSPLLAGVFTLFLLTFAGIPLTAGFVGKFAAFAAAFSQGAWALGLVGIACSAAAAFFYARIIVAMFFSKPPKDEIPGTLGVGVPTLGLTGIAVTLAAAVTLVLGVFPGPFLDFTDTFARLLVP
jgi:NADH-quinone oxidoreductase subunit N